MEALPSGISDTGGGATRALEIEAARGGCGFEATTEGVVGDCAAATKGTTVASAEKSADLTDMNPRKIAREGPLDGGSCVVKAVAGNDRGLKCESRRQPWPHPCRRRRIGNPARHLQRASGIRAPRLACCCPRRRRRRR